MENHIGRAREILHLSRLFHLSQLYRCTFNGLIHSVATHLTLLPTGSTVHIIGARANGGSSSFLITLDTLTFIGTSRSSGSDGKLVNQTLFDSGFVPALDASLPQHCIRIEHTGEPGEAVDFARFEIGHETRAGYADFAGYDYSVADFERRPSSASVVPVPSPLPDAFLSSDNPLAPASATVSSALPGTPTSRSSEALSAQTVQVMVNGANVSGFTTGMQSQSPISRATSSPGRTDAMSTLDTASVTSSLPSVASSTASMASMQAPVSLPDTIGATSVPKSTIIGLAVGVPSVLVVLMGSLIATRCLLRRQRKMELSSWSTRRGFRRSLDFECVGQPAVVVRGIPRQ